MFVGTFKPQVHGLMVWGCLVVNFTACLTCCCRAAEEVACEGIGISDQMDQILFS